MRTIIDALYEQNRQILSTLSDSKEISLAADVDNKLKKHLIMSAASYFETELREAIEAFAARASNNNQAVVSLIKGKALERQYHTYFDWESRKANKFFAHFGESFSQRCREDVRTRPELAGSIEAFLELGETRNKLAHLNFASFPIEKTSDEVYALFQKGLKFIEYVRSRFEEACQVAENSSTGGK